MAATITTVIPTFQRPALLKRAIGSVLAQTYRDCAVAVFDNASGDETAAVVAAIAARDSRVSYHCHKRNLGIVANFVYAMSQVRSPYFSVLSDDDVLFPEFFAVALRALEQHPEAVFFAGSTLEFDGTQRLRYAPTAYWPREGVYKPDQSVRYMLRNRHPTLPGLLFRSSLIDAIGVIDPGTGHAADLDYELRAAARFPIVVSFHPCAAWVNHPASQSGGETAAIVPSYEKIVQNLEAVETLPLSTRYRAVATLRRQLRGKLLEIAVKAQVRGDARASRDAASLLRSRYGSWVLGSALLAMSAACTRIEPLQRFLVWLESRRLQMRASASMRRSAIAPPDLERYAAHLSRRP